MSDKHVGKFREGRREGVEADRRVKASLLQDRTTNQTPLQEERLQPTFSINSPQLQLYGRAPPTAAAVSAPGVRSKTPNRKPAAPEHSPQGRFTCASCPSPPFVRSAAWFSDPPKKVSRPCSVAGRELVFKLGAAADTTPAKHTLTQRVACVSGV